MSDPYTFVSVATLMDRLYTPATSAEAPTPPAPKAEEFKGYKYVKADRGNARGPDGKVIRPGKNLSGNKPFQPKHYVLTKLTNEAELKATPNQCQLIVRWMLAHPTPARGGEIVAQMIAEGAIKTKIDPPVLFAYYRKLMERFGLTEV